MTTSFPPWVSTGAFALAFIAGWINIVGLLGFEQQAITHMTGTSSQLSHAIADASGQGVLRFALIMLAFVLGAAFSGAIIGKTSLKLGRRYSVALLMESLLLCIATLLLWRGSFIGVYCACAACGVQNALVTTYSGALIRTTHVSGMFTDLGIYLGHFARRLPVSVVRIRICVLVISGFILGGIIGALCFARLGNLAIAIPALLTGLAAIVYYVYETGQRRKPPISAPENSAQTGESAAFAAQAASDSFSQFEALVRWRRDVRHFQATAVPEALLERIFKLADLAPSVGLSQPWRVLRVQNPLLKNAVRANFEAANQQALLQQTGDSAQQYARLKLAGFDQAPVHLAVFCDVNPGQGRGLGRASMPQTLAYSSVCMIHTLMLAAHAEGLGVGWVSILDVDSLFRSLHVPEGWQFIGYLLIGYPVETSDVPELMRVGWQQRSDFAARWMQR